MKAMVYEKYGSVDELKLLDLPVPTPGKGEVLVKIHAASLNHGDGSLLRGKPLLGRLWSGLIKPKFQILGTDIAGEVIQTVDDSRFKRGDAVFGFVHADGFGAFTEYAAVSEELLTLKPTNISYEEAAAAPQAGSVALQGLIDKGGIQPDAKVLIIGASGGIGTFAVQIAKAKGAQVTGVCSSRNVELVENLGADHVVDYHTEDVYAMGQKFDLVLDIVANRSITECANLLTPQGTYVAVAFNPSSLFMGSFLSKKEGKKIVSLGHKFHPQDMENLRELMESRKVVPVINRVYSLVKLKEAFSYQESKKGNGKIVITMI